MNFYNLKNGNVPDLRLGLLNLFIVTLLFLVLFEIIVYLLLKKGIAFIVFFPPVPPRFLRVGIKISSSTKSF